MTSMLMESVVMAFVIGGITGAITALHLAGSKKVEVRLENERHKNNPHSRQRQ